jgi:hypothetical protein
MATKLWGYVSRRTGKVISAWRLRSRQDLRDSCPNECMVKRVVKHGTGYRIVGKG